MSLQTLPTQLNALDSLKVAYDAAQAEAADLATNTTHKLKLWLELSTKLASGACSRRV